MKKSVLRFYYTNRILKVVQANIIGCILAQKDCLGPAETI